MRRVFVDTLFWIAISNRKDQWHQAAEQASHPLAGCRLVTTDEVLIEIRSPSGWQGSQKLAAGSFGSASASRMRRWLRRCRD